MSNSSEITQRLNLFGQSKFGKEHGWKKRFADSLGISTQHLNRYLTGPSEPGKKMYLRLIQQGCDITWLLTGRLATVQAGVSKEERELLEELKRLGIYTVEQVRYVLTAENLAGDIAAAAVKEIKARYKKTRQQKKS